MPLSTVWETPSPPTHVPKHLLDAVAAANLLWKPLSEGRVDEADLARVQRARERPVRMVQAFQSFIQARFLKPTLESTRPPVIPCGVRLVARTPILRNLPPRLVAFGVNRPHVESPDRYHEDTKATKNTKNSWYKESS